MAAMIEKPNPTINRPGQEGDLKSRLTDHMDMIKRPNDLVRITQVSKHHFRVNTLSSHMAEDSVLPTYRITKSQFLHATLQEGELVITDQTRAS